MQKDLKDNLQGTKSADAVHQEKNKAVELALAQIEKQFGKGAIMKLGDQVKENVAVISTGALSLDVALGIGGVPKGRIVEIYGPESSGKSTLAMHIVAEAQKHGENAAYIDAEHSFDINYARNLGVDVDNLYVAQPDFGEQGLEMLELLVRSAGMGIIVVDSVAALTPRAEIEGSMGDSHMGLQARLMSQALRKITSVASKTGTTIIFLNQLRMKIGVMFGNPETTTGGNALKFYASVRMDIRQKDKIEKDGAVIGHVRHVKIVKNKMAPPFREASFSIIYPTGIDKESSIIDAAITKGVIQKAGSWLKMGDEQLAQGKEAVAELLRKDDKLKKKIVDEVMKKVRE